MEVLRIAASSNAVNGARMARVLGFWLEAGADAASASIYDAATATGTVRLSAKSPLLDSRGVIFPQPLLFNTAISVTLSGTNPVLYIMVE